MKDFTFKNPTEIIFGRGKEMVCGEVIKKYSGGKVLFHYGGGSIKKIGLHKKIIESLKTAGLEYVELGGVKPNPRLSMVRKGIELCRNNNIDFILAVGGGSVIDSAKAIASGATYEGDVWDFFENKETPKTRLPLGVVLTIPAAGSEASNSCVITKKKGWLKRSYKSERNKPDFAILNPEITFSLPDYQTACGAVDIMAHVMERYFTNQKYVDYTDRLCEATLNTVIKNIPIVLEEPENYEARAEIMWAGTLAHNGLVGTGRIGDWSSHLIEHEISGIYDVAHGAGLAIIFPAWMKFVYKQNIDRFAQYATRVWNIELNFAEPERTAYLGIKSTENFFKSIGMPVRLSEIDITDDRLEEMADKCILNNGDTLGNLVKLTRKDILKIYKLAL